MTMSDESDLEPVVSFTVTDRAMRPASDKHQCVYCQKKIGEPHEPDCVLISKKVKIRMSVEYEAEVPANWDKSDIEFHRNEGAWCANNAITELKKIFDDKQNGCMCPSASFEYLGGDTKPYLTE